MVVSATDVAVEAPVAVRVPDLDSGVIIVRDSKLIRAVVASLALPHQLQLVFNPVVLLQGLAVAVAVAQQAPSEGRAVSPLRPARIVWPNGMNSRR